MIGDIYKGAPRRPECLIYSFVVFLRRRLAAVPARISRIFFSRAGPVRTGPRRVLYTVNRFLNCRWVIAILTLIFLADSTYRRVAQGTDALCTYYLHLPTVFPSILYYII